MKVGPASAGPVPPPPTRTHVENQVLSCVTQRTTDRLSLAHPQTRPHLVFGKHWTVIAACTVPNTVVLCLIIR